MTLGAARPWGALSPRRACRGRAGTSRGRPRPATTPRAAPGDRRARRPAPRRPAAPTVGGLLDLLAQRAAGLGQASVGHQAAVGERGGRRLHLLRRPPAARGVGQRLPAHPQLGQHVGLHAVEAGAGERRQVPVAAVLAQQVAAVPQPGQAVLGPAGPEQPGEHRPPRQRRGRDRPLQQRQDLVETVGVLAQHGGQGRRGPCGAGGAHLRQRQRGAPGVVEPAHQSGLEDPEGRHRDHRLGLAEAAGAAPHVAEQEVEAVRGVGVVGRLAPVADRGQRLDGVAQAAGGGAPPDVVGGALAGREEGGSGLGVVHDVMMTTAGGARPCLGARCARIGQVGAQAG